MTSANWMFGAALGGSVALGCDNTAADSERAESRFVLASVVIDADGNRTTYVQTLPSLDAAHVTNDTALELPGNGVVIAGKRDVYVGLAEEPTWVRYSLDDSGQISETGRLSLLNYGASYIDFGNTWVDDETAVSVLSGAAVAVVWNPKAMELKGAVDLGHLPRAGYELEVWTTVSHEGLVYVPARFSDWEGARIGSGVSMTIIDPKSLTIVGVAEDDRCASGGRVVFDRAGYGYVMGDGRNYSAQMFAHASGAEPPDNCLLRIPPGGSDFEQGYFHSIPALTGGLQSITELQPARQGSGVAFAKMFYRDELPPGVQPVDFAFWAERANKLWRLELGDVPAAREVEGAPFSAIGFDGSALHGRLYSGESLDGGGTSEVYEVDPQTNEAVRRFTMNGYFYGLYDLSATSEPP